MLVASGHCSEHTIIGFTFVCATLCELYLRQHDEAHKEGEEADPEEEELPAVFTPEQSGMHVHNRCHEALNAHELMAQARQEVICSYFGSNVWCKSDLTPIVEEKNRVCLHTWLSSPRNTIMMKKSAAHRVEKGIMLTARG